MKPIIHAGREVSLAHLKPMTIKCPCKQIDRDIVIRVAFTNHCYTEAFDPELHTHDQIVRRDSPQRARIFSEKRHRLSAALPGLVSIFPSQKVHQTTQERNYVYEANVGVDGTAYEIYFMIQRADGERSVDLRLTIESAYPSDGVVNLRKRPSSIRFSVLAYKILMRQPVLFSAR